MVLDGVIDKFSPVDAEPFARDKPLPRRAFCHFFFTWGLERFLGFCRRVDGLSARGINEFLDTPLSTIS
jgi:hypothetical protein